MAFHPVTNVRLLLNDFRRVRFDDPTLKRLLMHGAHEMAERGLLLQAQETIDLIPGVKEYAISPRWVQTYAVIREEVQAYIAIRDQANVVWYWTMTHEGSPLLTDTRPAGLDLTPATIPHWFRWTSPNGTPHYVYPSLLGSLIVSDTAPLVGAGMTNTMELRARTRRRWFAGVTNQASASFTPFAGTPATLRASQGPVVPLTLIAPEAFGRLDLGAPASGPPQYATVWSHRLWVSPTPDAGYQLDHKFFVTPLASEEVYDVPQAFRRLPVWKALSLALRSQGRLAASQSMQAIFEAMVAYMAVLYHPIERDSREEAALPR